MYIRSAIFFISTALLSLSVQADLIFTAPPREKSAEGNRIYQPIADGLSKLLNTRVTYQHPGNWLTYSYKMRKNKYDIVFDGPQFASWRIKHIEHDALIRLKGTLDFYVITKKSNTYNNLDDLNGLRVCGLASPNLATLSMMREFKNPAKQPHFIEVKGGMKKVFDDLHDDKCVAAVLRDNIFKNKIDKTLADQYKIIWKSNSLPNQTITAGKNITPEMKQTIIKAFTTENGALTSSELFKRFSASSKHYIPASNSDYDGISNLMEGYVRGW